ncbi:MAG: SprT family zinc-dependent metalloprotease [Hydrogenophaga sp.]|uniref:M48 family metallopeptidase n=1 Tax=Hydrogenophaga sp. TaxID=1904254 RepID=UPI00276AC341|nr:SprT family zinc-dependent metalloprotease [Hydrogenophaga sp.]MDP2419245.1 SprT family zinc-dependent metalloprotease [Hydrogenophaga sp.]MDZ4188878.1 SprT family zinc-dependent metalloprotease [Hydrogenophaga sp.]
MSDMFELGDITISLTRKGVKNVHLTVHPPDGRVTLVAPLATRTEVARAYAISRLHWIRQQQQGFREQQREQPRQFVTRESHHLWGRRYLMTVTEADTKPHVRLDHRQIRLFVRPGADQAKKAEVIHEWHKALLHAELPGLISTWELKLGVKVNGYYLQRMKTQWGSCNHRASNIRLNTELVKKPKDLLEYVVVHEMLHLLVPTHSPAFVALLDRHWPGWREARQELNALALSAT